MSRPLPTRAEVEHLVRDARRKVRLRPDPGDIEPARAGQQSVWSYPRPPRVESSSADVRVMLDGQELARSSEVLRVIETSGPPVIYLPAAAFQDAEFIEREDWALCEWKGVARYLDLRCRSRHVDKAGWCFPYPFEDLGCGYERLIGHIAIFPGKFACQLDGEQVTPQDGGYYGGWITSKVKGPFKGGEGTEDW